MTTRRDQQSGVALVALATVIALFGSLKLATEAVQRRTAADTSDRAVTAERLAAAERALVRYATRKGKLPCPADGTVGLRSEDGSTEQTAATSDNCTIDPENAVLPWAELGLQPTKALDGWDRRISYFPNLPDRDAEIASVTGADDAVAFVLVSHGANGLGAHTINGTHVPGVGGSSQDEQDNVDGDGGTPATFHASSYKAGPSVDREDEFDDQVRFLRRGALNDRCGKCLDDDGGGS
ncbi:hypothetical protein SAMN05216241_102233 [Limimonas halophila]|uniref:Type II secretory pathway, pseudopilin PulG n=1 Tax=Limimonas halophila TaxID=1082479 RepID=A0A1G7NMU9_9PROT|nr:hypothetical protein [Limimonas halophila]SDF75415.1 hypothetical protein SAMN05216241_102233 [Limimonas halophila]